MGLAWASCQVYSWGSGNYGRLGLGSSAVADSSCWLENPTAMDSGESHLFQVSLSIKILVVLSLSRLIRAVYSCFNSPNSQFVCQKQSARGCHGFVPIFCFRYRSEWFLPSQKSTILHIDLPPTGYHLVDLCLSARMEPSHSQRQHGAGLSPAEWGLCQATTGEWSP